MPNFFHHSSLDPGILETLLRERSPEELPYDTSYGDGAPIEAETLEILRAAYAAETRTFPWRAGDLLVVDNMLVAHGRAPYSGPRRVLVAMTELHGLEV